MFKFVRKFIRSLFPASPSATVTVVSPLKTFEYTTFAAHSRKVMGGGAVSAPDESTALRSIYALHGERVQFANGARYRAHGNGTFTRIDRVGRATHGRRRHARERRKEGEGGIVGE